MKTRRAAAGSTLKRLELVAMWWYKRAYYPQTDTSNSGRLYQACAAHAHAHAHAQRKGAKRKGGGRG
jgi:hypothetical protein